MQILLDTDALLWTVDLDARLGERARGAIEDADVVVSVVSLWAVIAHGDVRRLAIEDSHMESFGELPVVHRDPFDRMLIAQARVEGLTVVTSDAVFGRYDVPVLDARS